MSYVVDLLGFFKIDAGKSIIWCIVPGAEVFMQYYTFIYLV